MSIFNKTRTTICLDCVDFAGFGLFGLPARKNRVMETVLEQVTHKILSKTVFKGRIFSRKFGLKIDLFYGVFMENCRK